MTEPAPGGPMARRRWRPLAPGLALCALLAAAALAAPALSPLRPAAQDDPVAGRLRPPGTRLFEVRLAGGRLLLAEEAEPTAGGLRVTRLGEVRTIPAASLADPQAAPERRTFPLGSDAFGRDVWARLLYGARISLSIGALAALLAMTLGVAIGGAAAYAGGAVDFALMRFVDSMLAFPRLFLVVALAAVFETGETVVVLVLAATGWMGASRLVRAEILALRERDFVAAAEAVGQRPRRIFLRHLLPNALAPVIVSTALLVGDIILVEAALSFLGLGVQPPTPSWGNMVADGAHHVATAWWVSTFPGLAIALAVVALHLLGDGLRDALDPRFAGG